MRNYLVSYNYANAECQGFGHIEITTNKKLKYDDFGKTREIISNALGEKGLKKVNVIILNIVKLPI